MTIGVWGFELLMVVPWFQNDVTRMMTAGFKYTGALRDEELERLRRHT
jgi:hypothetical protein